MTEKVEVFLQQSVFLSFFIHCLLRLSLSHCHALLLSFFPLPTLLCPLFSTGALAPLSLYPMPLSLPLLSPCLSLAPSLLSLSAVQHSDYHSSHRVRPDSQILLSTLLHHLLLVGAVERERLRQRKERRGRKEGGTVRLQ